jgi:hypothetical protein
MVVLCSEVATCLSSLITVLSGLLTPAILLITTYIAIQQYRVNKKQYLVNKRQHTLALFNKRFAVFNATNKFIRAVMGGKVDLDTILAFNVETAQDEFLFGKEIKDYLEGLRETTNGIYELKDKGRNQTGGLASEDRKELCEMEIRFKDQAGALREKFLKYFDFREP